MPTIVPEPGTAGELAGRLLKAAGDQPERVRTVTAGSRIAFEVDDDLAKAVGAGSPDSAPKPRRRTRKATDDE